MQKKIHHFEKRKKSASLLACFPERSLEHRQADAALGSRVSHAHTDIGTGCGPEGSAGAETALRAAGFRHPRTRRTPRARLSEGRLSVEEVGLAG